MGLTANDSVLKVCITSVVPVKDKADTRPAFSQLRPRFRRCANSPRDSGF